MNINPERLRNGNVLIKLRQLNDKIKLKGGGELFLDTIFQEMEHTNIVADVIAVPYSAHYYDYSGGRHEIPVELLSGDVVYCFYLAIQKALKQQRREKIVHNPEGRMIVENGEIYLLINYYNNFFMALRNGFPIMLNDYILIEPTYRELKTIEERCKLAGIGVPYSMKEQWAKNTQYGIVRYIGKNIIHEEDPAYFSDKDLKVGCEVYFLKNADIPLEYDIHRTFEPNKRLMRIQRRNIFFILEK
jgi:hypothetical protein